MKLDFDPYKTPCKFVANKETMVEFPMGLVGPPQFSKEYQIFAEQMQDPNLGIAIPPTKKKEYPELNGRATITSKDKSFGKAFFEVYLPGNAGKQIVCLKLSEVVR